MDDKAQMYVYEAITVVIMIIAAVVFFANLMTSPTVSSVDPYTQLEITCDDVLRSIDYSDRFDGTPNTIAKEIYKKLPSETKMYMILTTNGINEEFYDELGNGPLRIADLQYGEETVSAHRIIAENGNIYDFQIVVWYENF